MNADIVLDLVKLIVPSVIAYLVWLTKSVLKQGNDLDKAFTKIRWLEKELNQGDDQ